MSEYIKREAALNVNFRVNVNIFESRKKTAERAVQAYADEIAKLPAEDVGPIARGRWYAWPNPNYSPFDDSGETKYQCNRCMSLQDRESAYCPHCGAVMEDDREG